MMNKLKEQLRLRMLGQLSDEKTNIDINNAYSVAVDFTLSFLTFLREKCVSYDFAPDEWGLKGEGGAKEYTDKEMLNKFLEEYERKI